MYLGIDVGSVTVKVVLLDDEEEVISSEYVRSHGEPISKVVELLDGLFDRFDSSRIKGFGTSGSGGELFSSILGGNHHNELIAQAHAITNHCPQARTVIEIGGQDSKLLIMGEGSEGLNLIDFALNNQCSAGTGSFLDRQSERLGYSIDKFSRLALESDHPPRIAGRCSVFAKSDIIHLQQVGTPDQDIINGLCYAVARNFVGDIGRGKNFEPPVVFQGGVSRNEGMVRAFRDVLGLSDSQLIVPRREVLMSAIGTALLEKEGPRPNFVWERERQKLLSHAQKEGEVAARPPLGKENGRGAKDSISENSKFHLGKTPPAEKSNSHPIAVYIGLDVGSISTNLAAITEDGQLLARVYLQTAGKPIKAVQDGLRDLQEQFEREPQVEGVAVTGSGREMIASLLRADLVKNEITSQGVHALSAERPVDTVFEIGGQDSKFIRLREGAITNFTMNKACAAGTGSFLEEQAARLDVDIEDFGALALDSEKPLDLGERCTVFMESDLIHHQQRGAKKTDLVAGLAYSVAVNYLNRVVGDSNLGENISFQGGVASNEAVLSAFRNLLPEKSVTVPPNHRVSGAVGAAILARDYMSRSDTPEVSSFFGFDFAERSYQQETFICGDCSNQCQIRRIHLEGGDPVHYGSRCGKYEESQHDREKFSGPEFEGSKVKDLFGKRKSLIWEESNRKELENGVIRYPSSGDSPRGVIGIPRVLMFWSNFPYWLHFFRSLGYEVVLSGVTDKELVKTSVQKATAETCLPAKIVHGHVERLLAFAEEGPGLDYLFLPSIVSNPHENTDIRTNYNCPLIQGLPYITNGQFDFRNANYPVKVLQPALHFYRENQLRQELDQLGKNLRISSHKVEEAHSLARKHQREINSRFRDLGCSVLDKLSPSAPGLVIISRSYNSCDSGLNLQVPEKLARLGAIPIPIDFLPLEKIRPDDIHPFMQWDWGKRILSASSIISSTPNLYGVYLSHFRCGPDSFLKHYVKKIMEDKPLLELELDEHSADAGIVTRCEAFLDSLQYQAEESHSDRSRDLRWGKLCPSQI